MRINVAIPEAEVKKPVLDAALEAVTRLNEQLIKSGSASTFKQALTGPGVRWQPEPPGAEHFDHAQIVSARGWGDCDDLAPWHAASLRATGEDKGAKAIVIKSGPQRWHAIVERSNGKTKYEDPSEAAGMGSGNGMGISGGIALPMMTGPNEIGSYIVRPQLALRPVDHGWEARTDIPWHWRDALDAKPSAMDIAMTALHQHPVANTAIVGALDGAVLLAETAGFADPAHIKRVRCFRDYCDGMPLDELAQVYGDEDAAAAYHTIGSFWSAIKNVAKAAVSPVTSTVRFVKNPSLKNLTRFATDPITSTLKAAQPLASIAKPFTPLMRFIPGIGPVAASAVDLVQHGLPTSFGDAASMFMRNAPSFIPGVGPALSMAQNFTPLAAAAQQFMPQMPQPQAPQYAPPQYRPQAPQQYAAPQYAQQQPLYAQPPPSGQQYNPFSFQQPWPGVLPGNPFFQHQ
jgi:hypothetical protein